jgi:hypothetical protein
MSTSGATTEVDVQQEATKSSKGKSSRGNGESKKRKCRFLPFQNGQLTLNPYEGGGSGSSLLRKRSLIGTLLSITILAASACGVGSCESPCKLSSLDSITHVDCLVSNLLKPSSDPVGSQLKPKHSPVSMSALRVGDQFPEDVVFS